MTRSRGVLLVLVLAGALWAISLASWQTAVGPDTLGPTGVAVPRTETAAGASPVATACVAVIAVCGLLAAMLGRMGRFVVLGLSALAALGYAGTALAALLGPAATRWPIAGVAAGALSAAVIAWVAVASASWANSTRYDRSARGAGTTGFDSTATWDALSRGEDPEAPGGDPETPGKDPEAPDADGDDDDRDGGRDPGPDRDRDS
ncbi:tryptophan-associated transmembrane protein [Brevibacterium sanguinis]|uniref:Tryptophan-associated transmembrane protein n=2 Tax=Brevibacterium TaxID=1696 RepID=A0A366IGZ9_9MICO|nr:MULTISPECIES: Trp biosynthesis-associated membrane protein [Brevibacterium]RBP61606.1 tryptophan-associated transmembrane protein [Brevibacterium sanguinis]RBP70858.1 tryptophan-associated transmembrane protein [Brevibacterium celere]